jgi:hypothetical protein
VFTPLHFFFLPLFLYFLLKTKSFISPVPMAFNGSNRKGKKKKKKKNLNLRKNS